MAAVTAVALVVMMVLVVLSIMSGLVEHARRLNHQWSGDIVMGRESLVGFPYYDEFIAELEKNEVVEVATPIVRAVGLIREERVEVYSAPVQLMGVKLEEFCRVTNLAETLHYRGKGVKPTFLVPQIRHLFGQEELTAEQRRRGCILGRDVPVAWGRIETAWRGTELVRYVPRSITIFALDSSGSLTGSQMGETQTFWYVDDCESGLWDVDRSSVYVDFDELQQLCWMAGQDGKAARASEIRIKLSEGVPLEEGRETVAAAWQEFVLQKKADGQAGLLSDVKVQSWQQYRRDSIAPLEREKSLMIMVFCMMALVVVFIVFAIFYMIVTERIKDLGIIRTVGGSGWSMGQVFLGYGVLVGIVGAVVGTALGGAIVLNSNEIEGWLHKHFGFQLWSPDLAYMERIPDVVNWQEATVIGLAAVLAAVLGAAAPARRAAKLEVIEALQVE